MVDALQCAVIGPQIKIIVDRALRWQVFRHRTPLTASRQNVHEAVHYLAHDHRALAATGLARWDQQFDQLPFRVSQITRIAQFATVITRAAFARPHRVTVAMRKQRIAGSRSAVWRFFDRHRTSAKKSLQAAEQKCVELAQVRRRWMRQRGMFDPARLAFIDETATSTSMVQLRGRCPRGVGSAVALRQAGQPVGHLTVALGMRDLSARRVTSATVVGKGSLIAGCHSTNRDGDQINTGTYADTAPGSREGGTPLVLYPKAQQWGTILYELRQF